MLVRKWNHWNLNGFLARNCKKFYLVEAFVVLNSIDTLCISEVFLDSSADNMYDGLKINDYTLVRSKYPSNTKRGGEAIYHKDDLPVIRRNDISSLIENIVLEMRLVNTVSLPAYIDHLVKARTSLINFVQVLTCLCQILMTKSH